MSKKEKVKIKADIVVHPDNIKHIMGGIKCTSCGDEICSFDRHDYVNCKCGKTFVDGGRDYLRHGEGVIVRHTFQTWKKILAKKGLNLVKMSAARVKLRRMDFFKFLVLLLFLYSC